MDQPGQYPPALQDTINQHVQREVNKSLQRFFTKLNDSYEKQGLQSLDVMSVQSLAAPQTLGTAGSPPIHHQASHPALNARASHPYPLNQHHQPPHYMSHSASKAVHPDHQALQAQPTHMQPRFDHKLL